MKKSLNIYILITLAIVLLGSSIFHYYQSLQQDETAKSEQKISSLREAISLNNLEVVKFLIKSGANVEQPFTVDEVISYNSPNEKGFTALGWALFSNRPEIAKYLIENGANVKASVPVESSLLYWAIAHEMNDIAIILIDKGADIRTNNRYNPAQHADIIGLSEVVKKLVEKGVLPQGEGSEDLD